MSSGRPQARTPQWTERCAEILRRNEGKYHDDQMAALIEAATGMRFTAKCVQRHRLAAGLDACRRNDHTAPLARFLRSIMDVSAPKRA